MLSIWEGVMLALACSGDAFALGFAYGVRRIRIPVISRLVITLCCTVFLGGALLFGDFVQPYLPVWLTNILASGILFAIGVVKLFEKAEPKDGDKNKDQFISPGEAALLSAALSLDGLAVGFGAGVGKADIPAAVIASLIFGMAAIYYGCRLGGRLSLPFNPAKAAGAILIALALLTWVF